jgi:NitT/TauT family transport system substrate-binding protein
MLPAAFHRIARRLIGALVLTAAAGTALAQTPAKIRFILDWRFEGPASLFLMGVNKGYYKDEGLDVTIDAGTGSGAAVTRVASGVYDMGFADISAMIEFIGNNPDNPGARMQAVYMLYDLTPAAVFALKKSGIKTPADLVGKTLGAPVFDAGRKAFPIFAKANRIELNSVKWTTMDPPLRETMLVKGDVQAITGFTFTSLLNLNARGVKDQDVVMLKYPDYGVPLYGNAVIASQRFINENPKAVAGFLRALTKGIRDVIQNPDAAIDQVLKGRDPLIDATLEKRRLRLALDTVVATPNTRANGVGDIDRPRFAVTVVKVAEAFNLKNTPDSNALFNSSFLPAPNERKVFAK